MGRITFNPLNRLVRVMKSSGFTYPAKLWLISLIWAAFLFSGAPVNADPYSSDTDGDGYSDGEELAGGYDPNNSAVYPGYEASIDSDGDGYSDYDENNQGSNPSDPSSYPGSAPDPASQDTDGDGYSDTDETAAGTDPYSSTSYPGSYVDPYTIDSDGDGFTDGVESSSGTNPYDSANYPTYGPEYSPDTDGDTYSDADEVSNGTDPNNAASYPGSTYYSDSDWDGWSDGDEIAAGTDPNNSGSYPGAPDPYTTDSDGDGYYDYEENSQGTDPYSSTSYPGYLNSIDSDGDGHYDADEIAMGYNPNDPASFPGMQNSTSDSDGDGHSDYDENMAGTNPYDSSSYPGSYSYYDSDGDGYYDNDEYVAGTNPYDPTNYPGSTSYYIDTDGDGLYDSEEQSLGTNPNLIDSDDDGLSDFSEVRGTAVTLWIGDSTWGYGMSHTYTTNPNNPDTDGDLLPDGWEIFNGTVPDNAADGLSDGDNDGLSLGRELTTHFTDPTKRDTDEDGESDGYEVAQGTNPLVQSSRTSVDTDGDVMSDQWETQYGLDPTSATDASGDGDDDGLINLREYFLGTSPANPDSDGDGYKDGFEWDRGFNPLNSGDASQDSDGDYMPDLWEFFYGLDPGSSTDRYSDSDGDWVQAEFEFYGGLSPNNADTDGDGISDYDEYYGIIQPPLDSDGDQINDSDEIAVYETDPYDSDSDDDGISDYGEIFGSVIQVSFNGQNMGVGFVTNPNLRDTDEDGMDDLYEILHFFDPTDLADGSQDEDGDTIFNGVETSVYLTDPFKSDTDADGESDSLELAQGTDPLNPHSNLLDSDGDLMRDSWELANQLNPSDPSDATGNPDDDGLVNVEEFQNNTNPHARDSDGDGYEDRFELIHGFSPSDASDATNDSDEDDMPDLWELSHQLNPSDPGDADDDFDNDMLWNVDEFLHGTRPDRLDSDLDGLDDFVEVHTPRLASPGEAPSFSYTDPLDPDSDGDLLSDGFEVSENLEPLLPLDGAADRDGDGLSNGAEVSIHQTDWKLRDTDSDGEWDGFEIENETNPLDILSRTSVDSDGDHMSDEWELAKLLNPLVADGMLDPDDDGLNNHGEYLANTMPFNPDTDDDTYEDGFEREHGRDPLSAADATVDADEDFLPDLWEILYGLPWQNRHHETNDPDNDGVNNLTEFENRTSPRSGDSDGDGLSDSEEIAGSGTTPTGIEWVYAVSPTKSDSDEDDEEDLFEIENGTDPTNPASKSSISQITSLGVPDVPSSPFGAFGYMLDRDRDGVSDEQEAIDGTNPLNASDFLSPHPEAADGDRDGILDAWELANGLNPADRSDATGDWDYDGLTNSVESRLGTNPKPKWRQMPVSEIIPYAPGIGDPSLPSPIIGSFNQLGELAKVEFAGTQLSLRIWSPLGGWSGTTSALGNLGLPGSPVLREIRRNRRGVTAASFSQFHGGVYKWHLRILDQSGTLHVFGEATPWKKIADLKITESGLVVGVGQREDGAYEIIRWEAGGFQTIGLPLAPSPGFNPSSGTLVAPELTGLSERGVMLLREFGIGASSSDRRQRFSQFGFGNPTWGHLNASPISMGPYGLFPGQAPFGDPQAISPSSLGVSSPSPSLVSLAPVMPEFHLNRQGDWGSGGRIRMLNFLVAAEDSRGKWTEGGRAYHVGLGELIPSEAELPAYFNPSEISHPLWGSYVFGINRHGDAIGSVVPDLSITDWGYAPIGDSTIPLEGYGDAFLVQHGRTHFSKFFEVPDSGGGAPPTNLLKDHRFWRLSDSGHILGSRAWLQTTTEGEGGAQQVSSVVSEWFMLLPDNDSDHDGMADDWEWFHFGSSKRKVSDDPDGDGISNRLEFAMGTNPLLRDSDHDLGPDQWELDKGWDPLGDSLVGPVADTDTDTLPDFWEMLYGLPWQNVDDRGGDPDNDGADNQSEYTNRTDPTGNDTDGDRLPDAWEIAKGLQVTVQDGGADPDQDGLTNYAEFLAGTEPKNPDTDGDGYLDGFERRHLYDPKNPQDALVDSDNDDLPDLWELLHDFPPDSGVQPADPDFDLVLNIDEYLNKTNPRSPDTDGDGISDRDEIFGEGTLGGRNWTYDLDPTKADSDGDGYDDDKEIRGIVVTIDGESVTYYTDPSKADTDGDGLSDRDEILGFGLTAGNIPWSFRLDPTKKDSDGDGIDDLVEIQGAGITTRGRTWSYRLDPTTDDTDGDGLKDVDEIEGFGVAGGVPWEFDLDPTDPDTDNDGLSDFDEVVGHGNLHGTEWTFFLDPTKPDTDGDGLVDSDEILGSGILEGVVWNFDLDPTLRDTDGDGLPDGEEILGSGTYEGIAWEHVMDPTNPDLDNDGLKDGDEIRGHGEIDGVEWNFVLDPEDPDTDGDGLLDGDEVRGAGVLADGRAWAFKLDPTRADTDRDGLSDSDEIRGTGVNSSGGTWTFALDPTNPDFDGDQLSDGDEVNGTGVLLGINVWNFVLNPVEADSDGDGQRDDYEILHGSNPADRNTLVQIGKEETNQGMVVADLNKKQSDWFKRFLHGGGGNALVEDTAFLRPEGAFSLPPIVIGVDEPGAFINEAIKPREWLEERGLSELLPYLSEESSDSLFWPINRHDLWRSPEGDASISLNFDRPLSELIEPKHLTYDLPGHYKVDGVPAEKVLLSGLIRNVAGGVIDVSAGRISRQYVVLPQSLQLPGFQKAKDEESGPRRRPEDIELKEGSLITGGGRRIQLGGGVDTSELPFYSDKTLSLDITSSSEGEGEYSPESRVTIAVGLGVEGAFEDPFLEIDAGDMVGREGKAFYRMLILDESSSESEEVEYRFLAPNRHRCSFHRLTPGRNTSVTFDLYRDGYRRTIRVTDPNGTDLSEPIVQTLQDFPWGREVVAIEGGILGGGATVVFKYSTNPDEPNYGKPVDIQYNAPHLTTSVGGRQGFTATHTGTTGGGTQTGSTSQPAPTPGPVTPPDPTGGKPTNVGGNNPGQNNKPGKVPDPNALDPHPSGVHVDTRPVVAKGRHWETHDEVTADWKISQNDPVFGWRYEIVDLRKSVLHAMGGPLPGAGGGNPKLPRAHPPRTRLAEDQLLSDQGAALVNVQIGSQIRKFLVVEGRVYDVMGTGHQLANDGRLAYQEGVSSSTFRIVDTTKPDVLTWLASSRGKFGSNPPASGVATIGHLKTAQIYAAWRARIANAIPEEMYAMMHTALAGDGLHAGESYRLEGVRLDDSGILAGSAEVTFEKFSGVPLGPDDLYRHPSQPGMIFSGNTRPYGFLWLPEVRWFPVVSASGSPAGSGPRRYPTVYARHGTDLALRSFRDDELNEDRDLENEHRDLQLFAAGADEFNYGFAERRSWDGFSYFDVLDMNHHGPQDDGVARSRRDSRIGMYVMPMVNATGQPVIEDAATVDQRWRIWPADAQAPFAGNRNGIAAAFLRPGEQFYSEASPEVSSYVLGLVDYATDHSLELPNQEAGRPWKTTSEREQFAFLPYYSKGAGSAVVNDLNVYDVGVGSELFLKAGATEEQAAEFAAALDDLEEIEIDLRYEADLDARANLEEARKNLLSSIADFSQRQGMLWKGVLKEKDDLSKERVPFEGSVQAGEGEEPDRWFWSGLTLNELLELPGESVPTPGAGGGDEAVNDDTWTSITDAVGVSERYEYSPAFLATLPEAEREEYVENKDNAEYFRERPPLIYAMARNARGESLPVLLRPVRETVVEEITGTDFRSLSLDGSPTLDPGPTSIDAFDLGLRHGAGDLSVPLGASSFALGVSRSAIPEIWQPGVADPGERRDRPFGPGWHADIVSHIQFERGDLVVTTPEGVQRYRPYGKADGSLEFRLAPGYLREGRAFLNKLRLVTEEDEEAPAGATYLYESLAGRKYYFEERGRVEFRYKAEVVARQYARLLEVHDSTANRLVYDYKSDDMLIPETISDPDRDLEISFLFSDDDLRITQVTDPRSHTIAYRYKALEYGEGQTLQVLETVGRDGPNSGDSGYEFEVAVEKPAPTEEAREWLHLDLKSIRSNNSKYTFTYEFDESIQLRRQNWVTGAALPQPVRGRPRWVSEIKLPENLKVSFENRKKVTLSLTEIEETDGGDEGGTETEVTDIREGKFTYTFSQNAHRVLLGDPATRRIILGFGRQVLKSDSRPAETFTFDPAAAYAVKNVRDMNGRETDYTYGRSVADDQSLDAMGVLDHYDAAEYFPKFAELTNRTRPSTEVGDSVLSIEEFHSKWRIPTRVVDEGQTSIYVYNDDTGLLESEEHRDSGNEIFRRVEYIYDPDGSFKAFLRERRSIEYANDSGAGDYVEVFVPDAKGRVDSVTVGALSTSYEYDNNGNTTVITDNFTGAVTRYDFDESNRISDIELPADLLSRVGTIVYTYEPQANKVTVEEMGWVTETITDDLGRPKTVTRKGAHIDASGVAKDLVTKYDYPSVEETKIEVPGGLTTTVTTGSLGETLSVVEGSEKETTYRYNGNAGGSVFASLLPDRVDLPKVKTDGGFERPYVEFEYNDRYLLKKRTRSAGNTADTVVYEVTEYDLRGNARVIKTESGAVITQVHDGLGRVISTTVPLLGTSTTQYLTSTGEIWRTTDFDGNERVTEFDPARRVFRTSEPGADENGGTLVTEYDHDTPLQVKVSGAEGAKTDLLYDRRGNLCRIVGPAVPVGPGSGRPTITRNFDLSGNLVAEMPPQGDHNVWLIGDSNRKAWHYEHDGLGRVYRTIHPEAPAYGSSSVHLEEGIFRELNGATKKVELSSSQGRTLVTSFSNDEYGRTTKMSAPGGDIQEYDYDSQDNLIFLEDSKNKRTHFSYDHLGHQVKREFPVGSPEITLYNGVKLTGFMNGRGQTMHYQQDDLCRTTSDGLRSFGFEGIHLKTVTDLENPLGSVVYDFNPRKTSVLGETTAGKKVTYAPRINGSQETTTYPGIAQAGTSVVAQYQEGLSRFSALTEGGRTTGFIYDIAGNIIEKRLPNGLVEKNEYDYLGRLVGRDLYRGAERISECDYQYDGFGNVRVVSEINSDSGVAQVVKLNYDDANRLVSEETITPAVGHSLKVNQYDGNNNLSNTSIRTLAPPFTGFREIAFNPVAVVARDAEETDEELESTISTVQDEVPAPGGGMEFVTLTIRTVKVPFGDHDLELILIVPTGWTEPTADVRNVQFTQDGLNQLQGLSLSDGSEVTYTYDADGNRKTRKLGEVIHHYFWTVENRLAAVEIRSGGTVDDVNSGTLQKRFDFHYDYLGRRVVRSSGGSTRTYVYSGRSAVQEYLGGTTPATEYVRGRDMGGGVGGLLYTREGATGYQTAFSNHRGDVIARQGADGQTKDSAVYDAKGDRRQGNGTMIPPSVDTLGPNTKEVEEELGIVNYGYRYFDPEAGVWLSRDPAGYVDGPNLYAYVGQNPWSKVDPLGLETVSELNAQISKIDEDLLRAHDSRTIETGNPIAWLCRLFVFSKNEKGLWKERGALEKRASSLNKANLAHLFVAGIATCSQEERDFNSTWLLTGGFDDTYDNARHQANLADADQIALASERAFNSLVAMGGGAGAINVFSQVSSSSPVIVQQGFQRAKMLNATRRSGFSAKGGDGYVVSFMGSNGRKYYDNASATLGAPGGSVWVAPMDDIAGISNRAGVVTGTGHAPGPLLSYLKGDSIYGIAVPRSSVSLRLPSAADAGANQHFRLGGVTGVEHKGVWKSSNVREFILNGGNPVPKGSVFFEFGADGSWIPIRKF